MSKEGISQYPGKLIVICGIDGAGKKTQTNLLLKCLKREGIDSETISFPRYGERSAALVEDFLSGKFGTNDEVGPYRASIFFACDRYVASKNIYEWLYQGKVVVADRYVSANQAHQGCKIKDPEERERYLEWLENLEFH